MAYGRGQFCGFLDVLQPADSMPQLDLATRARRSAELLRTAPGVPFALDDLLPVAMTDNGDTVYWLRQGSPDAWKIVANGARNTKWPHFDGGIVAFLHAVLSGAHHVEVFPRSFPGSRRTFDPY
ncbi:hypothetical protein [Dactylosporangium darangshiense]|uniref:Uncharacterized protein n=1 Tax=Dactylosporangium darangshiense TaxID=579108 RepID=A0ABP8DRT7_9ACTN